MGRILSGIKEVLRINFVFKRHSDLNWEDDELKKNAHLKVLATNHEKRKTNYELRPRKHSLK